ncbi:SIR2 family protein, partial [Steroidobacter sp.]|uniref:SIR2 family protein n=1 Tax=Steroidobacter sp. TaxID=1978227 RepID=UPI001A4EE1D7
AQRSILPPAGDPTEYAAAFEAVYATEVDRRRYIDDKIRLGTPSFGHRVLAALISTGRVPCVFTTNFDPLIEISTTQTDQLLPAGERAMPTVAALDSVDRAARCLRESDWPLIAKLHGDYQSIKLKNTSAELQHQDGQMSAVLKGVCQRFGLVVVGYSGRDASVMEALEQAIQSPGAYPAGLYWVTNAVKHLLPAVHALLERAAAAGVQAAIVEAQNFDELSADIVSQFSLPAPLHEHVFELRQRKVLHSVVPPTVEARKFPVLRCSALLMDSLPRVARRLTLTAPASAEAVRALLKEAHVFAAVACRGNEVAAFGDDAGLLRALASLGARLDGTIDLKPEEDSWALGLLYDALIKALCRGRPLTPRLRRAGHAVLIARGKPDEDRKRTEARRRRLAKLRSAYGVELAGTVPALDFPYVEGVRLRMEHIADRWWCVFEPATFVDLPRREETLHPDPDADELSRAFVPGGDPVADWRRERWALKYNVAWTKIIDAWAQLLSNSADEQLQAFGIAPGAGLDAVFGVSGVTAWSRPAHTHAYFERQR